MKPFIAKARDGEVTARKYRSGELFTYYHDWKIEYCIEEIFWYNITATSARLHL
jgi:hypothetical protein